MYIEYINIRQVVISFKFLISVMASRRSVVNIYLLLFIFQLESFRFIISAYELITVAYARFGNGIWNTRTKCEVS